MAGSSPRPADLPGTRPEFTALVEKVRPRLAGSVACSTPCTRSSRCWRPRRTWSDGCSRRPAAPCSRRSPTPGTSWRAWCIPGSSPGPRRTPPDLIRYLRGLQHRFGAAAGTARRRDREAMSRLEPVMAAYENLLTSLARPSGRARGDPAALDDRGAAGRTVRADHPDGVPRLGQARAQGHRRDPLPAAAAENGLSGGTGAQLANGSACEPVSSRAGQPANRSAVASGKSPDRRRPHRADGPRSDRCPPPRRGRARSQPAGCRTTASACRSRQASPQYS